jgi:hypothetical protein
LVRTGTTADGESWFAFEGTLEGQGIWLDLPTANLTDSWVVAYRLDVACGRVLFVAPSAVEMDDEERHFAFEPDIRILGTGSHGGGRGASSSAERYLGGVTGVVADGEACVALNVTVASAVEAARATLFNATWTTHGPFTADQRAFSMPVVEAGWTHAHRVAACDTPAEPLAPAELLAARLDFPNGVTIRAGPYMNGIFPGPTVDDAVFFGVWHDEPGELAVDIAAPTPECLVVVSTDFWPSWGTATSGYVDRWWRQEPILP